jgi:hypothetical protein
MADARRPAGETTTAAVFRPFVDARTDGSSGMSNLPSGLIGPVVLERSERR